MERATRRQVVGLAVGSGVVAAAAVALSPGAILRAAERVATRPVLFALVLATLYLGRPVVLWPISAISILVGYVYGVGVGIPVALTGAVVTCLPPFLLARYAQTDSGLFGHLGTMGERLVANTGALRGIVAARLAPLPADPVSYAAGLSGVGSGQFVLGTLLGELPWVAAAVLAGHSMRSLALRGTDVGLWLVVGAASLAALLVAGPAYRHFRDRRPA